MSKLLLLGTLGCHLCEEAEAWIAHYFPDQAYAVKDISEAKTLVDRFGLRIPVLTNGVAEQGWPFRVEDIQSLLLNGDFDTKQIADLLSLSDKPLKQRRVLGAKK